MKIKFKYQVLILAFIAFLSLALDGNAQGHFRLSGDIEGLDTDFMIYYRDVPNSTYGYVRDTIKVSNGKFDETFPIDKYLLIYFSPNVDRTTKWVGEHSWMPSKSSKLNFIAFPDADIRFTGEISDFVDAYPSGDKTNDELAELHKQIFPLLNREVNLYVENYNKPEEQKKVSNTVREEIRKMIISIKLKFIEGNPSSIAALAYLSEMMLRSNIDDDKAISLFERVDPELKDISFYKQVEARIEGIRNSAIGAIMPPLTSNRTLNRELFELSSLRGKYVILDFWGTWALPSTKNLPKMKIYLDKYKNQLEIVSIAEDNEVRWRKFLSENEFYWHHLLNGEDEENHVFKLNVSGFPTTFIISPEGKILYKYIGEGDEFFDYLDELFKGL